MSRISCASSREIRPLQSASEPWAAGSVTVSVTRRCSLIPDGLLNGLNTPFS